MGGGLGMWVVLFVCVDFIFSPVILLRDRGITMVLGWSGWELVMLVVVFQWYFTSVCFVGMVC